MSGLKLRQIHVIIIGVFACVAVIAGLYFTVIKNKYKVLGELQSQYAAAEQKWNQKASVEAQLEEAKRQNRIITSKYERYLAEKMPPISFEDRAQGMIALWKEQSQVLGPLLTSWPRKTGVQYLGGIQVPAPPVDPNSIDTSLIKLSVGTVQVRGDFRSILSHIRSWNKFGRLVQIDPVSLTGPSPGMTAQYAVTVYIFPRGEAGPPIAMAGGGGGGAGVPGAPVGAAPGAPPMAAPTAPGVEAPPPEMPPPGMEGPPPGS